MAKAVDVKNEADFVEGQAYYCPECKRTHTKGKIYKEHLKYAQTEKDDEEKVDNAYDEEKELIEAFNELEDEVPVDEIESQIEEDIGNNTIDIEDNPYQTAEECVQAVKSLPGVGEATLNKLIKAGFNSLESIAYTPPSIIREDSGLGDKTTEKLIKASMELLNIGFKSADAIWEVRKNIARVTTSSQELDDLLGGGVETGSVIEFFGEFRTGKTQIMHQLCVNVQLPKEKGGLEGRALYIDTEGTFRPERIIQMAEGLDLDYNAVLKNIVFGRAYNSDHQILLINSTSLRNEKDPFSPNHHNLL